MNNTTEDYFINAQSMNKVSAHLQTEAKSSYKGIVDHTTEDDFVDVQPMNKLSAPL